MKEKLVPQNPIILRCHRIMEAVAKSDDERDFYLDRVEGFLVYVDLDKPQEELDALFKELHEHRERYVLIPKLTFYEIKKIMEQFVNEKVYDIDTKEKLLDIIQSKEARENFLEFIYDHHTELEKWQLFYQERFRIRIIEWLRNNSFDFVFEEDLEMLKSLVEKVKINMFTPKVGKDIAQARKLLATKASSYYSSEALNPRPKRGRPPKQVVKVEAEPQFSQDIYVAVPKGVKPFLFAPDYNSSSMVFTFSGKFASEADLLAHRKQQLQTNLDLNNLSQKLAALKALSANWQRESEGTGSFSHALMAEATDAKEAREAKAAKKATVPAAKVVKKAVAPTAKAAKKPVVPVAKVAKKVVVPVAKVAKKPVAPAAKIVKKAGAPSAKVAKKPVVSIAKVAKKVVVPAAKGLKKVVVPAAKGAKKAIAPVTKKSFPKKAARKRIV